MQSHSRTNYVFKYGEGEIQIVPIYEYLGLNLNEYMDYHFMSKMVAKSANRALRRLIAKSRLTGGMSYDVFMKLYNSLVLPVIDYEGWVDRLWHL